MCQVLLNTLCKSTHLNFTTTFWHGNYFPHFMEQKKNEAQAHS